MVMRSVSSIRKETMLASQKQDAMKAAFKDWIFKDQQRRERLVKVYNERFNSIRPREYDGSHLTFPGMNPEIELRPHQKNAVAHQLYGENVLLAHVVGAGKTYEMVAAAMEKQTTGIITEKSLCRSKPFDGAVGCRISAVISGSQYPGSNQERF